MFSKILRVRKGRAIMAGAAAFALCAGAALMTSTPALAAGKTVVVKMSDTPPVYLPAKVTINVGDTVEWDNNASTLHDVTTDADNVQKPADVSLPPGAKAFDSGFMQPGGKFSYTFTVPGTYKYACVPHEMDGMVGYVTVNK